jgi:hypothetical protein
MKYLTILIVLLIPISVSANCESVYPEDVVIIADTTIEWMRFTKNNVKKTCIRINYFLRDRWIGRKIDTILHEQPNHDTILYDDIADTFWTIDTMPVLQLGGLYIEATHDTIKEYMKIGKICDTTWITCAVYGCSCTRPFQITCHTDTIWADKVQVWLTPKEIEYLWQIVDNADSVLVSVFYLLKEVMPDDQ